MSQVCSTRFSWFDFTSALQRMSVVFVALTLLLIASACAQGGVRSLDRVSQRLVRPLIEGVGYDARGDRVFVSLCRARLYECDLAEISVSGAQRLRYLRSGGRWGYMQPTVSEGGRYLFAVRAPRAQRPGQRHVDQELVRIDLSSGEETIVAPANGYRYERLVALSETSVLAGQSYLSSADVACQGDFCTDSARVVLMGAGAPYVLPNVEGVGEVASVRVSIIPLGAGAAWIRIYSSRGGSAGGPTTFTWLFDAEANEISPATNNANVARAVFDAFARSHEGETPWRWAQLFPAGGPLELRPFSEDREFSVGVEQVGLSANGRAVRITKRNDRADVRFDIEVVRNEGVSPWSTVRTASVVYALPH